MNVIGYTRVVPGAETESALTHQKNRLQGYCALNGLTLTEVFTEIGSGDTEAGDGRSGLTAAISTCRPGDTLLVVRLDRLSSQKKLVAAIFEQCRGSNIDIAAVAGPQNPDEVRNSLEVTVQAG